LKYNAMAGVALQI